MIDGCGKVRIFSRIILPLTGPVLITTMIFTFIWTYNDFFAQLIYLSYPSSETVPVALRRFVDATGDRRTGNCWPCRCCRWCRPSSSSSSPSAGSSRASPRPA